jgi:hypothetical protein
MFPNAELKRIREAYLSKYMPKFRKDPRPEAKGEGN